ncbi:MAG: ABC transporter substrate-binding protein [Magnetococcales bacterium]|nr:ABC transporter substrate-binding protein [Magnetococcales bacterium]
MNLLTPLEWRRMARWTAHPLRFAVAAALLVVLALPLPGWAGDPSNQMKETVDRAIAVLSDQALKTPERKEERRKKLREIIYTRFDFNVMSQGAVGRQWKSFTPDQQQKFIPLFSRILENAYLEKIENYQGEQVLFTKEVLNTKKSGTEVARVDGVLQAKEREFSMSYELVKEPDGQWKVFDIVLEGVGVISNFRSQYQEVLKNNTVEKLLKDLEDKANKPPEDITKPAGK